jgi:putative FmdB family regulatory protein
MPIYEYCCEKCGKEFETLVMGSKDKPACPKCGGKKVKRMLSCFSTQDGISPASGACAPSGGFS